MTSHLARPPLTRRNAQDRVLLTVGARTQALQNDLERPSQFLQEFRESQLSLETLQNSEVGEETIKAENNALAAEQRRYYMQYQANGAAEAARAPQGSQQFDAAVLHARVQREHAAVDALPSHVRRTQLEAIAWSLHHLNRKSIIQYLRVVQPVSQASVASGSSITTLPDAPRPDAPRRDTRRPDTPSPGTFLAWSGYYMEYMRFEHYASPSAARRRLAVNHPAAIQEGEEEDVGQRFEIIDFGTQ
ncbi:predicted protein [Sclerotinia sclerotiorum 1980 UF-70]|uniref:Uncharacterized protein n=2 Tax=Sclerotinia sclerotiorum (strain ATCC 18683 / 1980 / Ss-1) TaxID=665079 RepID=A7F858_SCLS1|nr:predicted protein [Sclerotinia sclerotiorum 1980 UF-70]APA13244.1 hypothetical protein sscle_10g080140 [Sclerotinia sclerotiorum 1980 UF-70]EDN98929.1 predicted protein [Sclerotinia sclerotiorum 1980 UF-70]